MEAINLMPKTFRWTDAASVSVIRPVFPVLAMCAGAAAATSTNVLILGDIVALVPRVLL